MIEAAVPCIPGYHGSNQEPGFLRSEASKIGFPVLIKAVKGGGGKGMRIAMTADVFDEQLESAKSEAMSSFGDNVMLVEKYIMTPRHIEVQIFADKYGMYLYITWLGQILLAPHHSAIARRVPEAKRPFNRPSSYLNARVLVTKKDR